MKSIKSLFVFLIIVLLSACTEPGETTKMGAVTGGVLGAGLGAIVGNQTGDPGAGLAVGTVVGAGTGAAIGNALDAQQKSIRSQDEAIERQQKILSAQSKEIQELRNMPSDAQSALNGALRDESRARPSSSYVDAASGNSYTEQLNLGRLNAGSHPANRIAASTTNDLNSFNSVEEHHAAAKPTFAEQKEFKIVDQSHPQIAEQPHSQIAEQSHFQIAEQSRAALKPKSIETQANFASPENMNGFDENTFASTSIRENDIHIEETAPPKGIFDHNLTDTQTAKRVDNLSSDKTPECQKSNQELEKYNAATEAADRLFYLRRAIRLCPSSASLQNSLGDEYSKLGRNEDAKEAYDKALKLDPSLSAAKKGMASLSDNLY